MSGSAIITCGLTRSEGGGFRVKYFVDPFVPLKFSDSDADRACALAGIDDCALEFPNGEGFGGFRPLGDRHRGQLISRDIKQSK
jgi:hypothetical protein